MPARTYVDISDALIAAYSPWTARKVNRFRNNIDAVGHRTLVNNGSNVSGSTAEVTFTTVATLRLFVPSHLVGPGGTTLELEMDLDAGGAEGTPEADFRFVIGATSGNEATDDANKISMTISWTPTPDTVVDVLFQAMINDVLNVATMSWDKHETGRMYLLE